MLFFHFFLALVGVLPIVAASPFTAGVKANSVRANMATSQNKGDRLVFCHFMVILTSSTVRIMDLQLTSLDWCREQP